MFFTKILFATLFSAHVSSSPNAMILGTKDYIGDSSATNGNFTCKNPEVTWCYKTTASDCLTQLTKEDGITLTALQALPDKNVTMQVEKVLVNNQEFK